MKAVSIALIAGIAGCVLQPAFGANATNYTMIYSFTGGKHGLLPASLVSDQTGNLYGPATTNGGCRGGCGLVFRISPRGREKTIHKFTLLEGSIAAGTLAFDSNGNLYGAAREGGASNSTCRYGCGTVFKLAPDGTETTLHDFQAGDDGYFPRSGVIVDGNGNIYGTTMYGGNGCSYKTGCGTVFKVTSDGTETLLHSFKGGSDGQYPYGGLVLDDNGNLFGTTTEGGSKGYGEVFKLSPDGTMTLQYSFLGQPASDGISPYGDLAIDASGNLYGTTIAGGPLSGCNCGTVFEVQPNGSEIQLHVFTGGDDGSYPMTGVILDASGNLYGTTTEGGGSGTCSGGCGTAYELAPGGAETMLHVFAGGTDGSPNGKPAIYNGDLFGATGLGGSYGYGSVYEISQ